MINVAFVVALEREVSPLVHRWRVHEREHQGRHYKFFESENAVLVCAGIGAERARRAAEAVISLYAPNVIWSVGFAGALEPKMKVGQAFQPSRVVDASDGSWIATTGKGEGTLVSFPSIASVAQKGKLAQAYAAQAVDMEAAAVARGAQARGVRFAAYKVISDGSDFELPAAERFIRNGEFRSLAFVSYTMLRPWLWPRTIRLGKNSAHASNVLCRWLLQYTTDGEFLENKPVQLHPIKRA